MRLRGAIWLLPVGLGIYAGIRFIRNMAQEPDPRYDLAYQEAKGSITRQDGAIDDLRTRAIGVVSATTIAVSFIGGLGLVGEHAKLPLWAVIALAATVVGIFGCCLIILFPTGWRLDLSPSILIDDYIEGPEAEPVQTMQRSLALVLEDNFDQNQRKFDQLLVLFKVAVVLLLVDVLTLLAGITWR